MYLGLVVPLSSNRGGHHEVGHLRLGVMDALVPVPVLELLETPARPSENTEEELSTSGFTDIAESVTVDCETRDAAQLLSSSPADSPPPIAKIRSQLRDTLVTRCKGAKQREKISES